MQRNCDTVEPSLVYSLLQFASEEDVGCLASSIGLTRSIAIFEVYIVKVDLQVFLGEAHTLMGPGTHINHPKSFTLFEFVPQQRCQVKVTEVVGAHLHLEAINSHFTLGNGHHTCIVDKDVYLFSLLLYPLGELLDGALIAQIERVEVQPCLLIFPQYLLDGLFRLPCVSGTEDDGAGSLGQFPHSLFSNACVCSSDDNHLSTDIPVGRAGSAASPQPNASEDCKGGRDDDAAFGSGDPVLSQIQIFHNQLW